MKCNDCAFDLNTQASTSPHTLVTAHLCALTGETFYCHVNDAPCAGWAQARRERAQSRYRPNAAELVTANMCSELLSECVRLAKQEDLAALTTAAAGEAKEGE